MTDKTTPKTPKTLGVIASVWTFVVILLTVIMGSGPLFALRLAGGIVGLGALVLVFSSLMALGKGNEAASAEANPDGVRLSKRGVYRLIRHPRYLGFMLINVGFGLLAQNLPVIILAVIGIILFWLHSIQEDRHCLTVFGPDYEAYSSRVPRLNLIAGVIRALTRSAS